MAEEKEMPTERTPKGLEVPIPEREDFFANLKKAAKVDKPKSPATEPREQ